MSDEALPATWSRAPMRNLILGRESTNPRKQGKGDFKYIDIDALDNTCQRITSPKTLQRQSAPSRARVSVREGDVLFSLVRPYLKNVAVVPRELDGEVASTAYCPLRPAQGVDSRFLFYQVVQDSFVHSIPTYGNSPPAGRDDEFLDLRLSVAPLNEQRRIVAKLDELFSKLDAGVAALERVREKLKKYRASVLNAAVEGRLTEQWRSENPDVEPASVLLERILVERRKKWEEEQLRKYEEKGKKPPKGWREKYKEPVKPDTKDLPALPDGWCWSNLEQLAISLEGGNAATAQDDRTNRIVLRSSAVRQGSIDFEDHRFLAPDAPSKADPFLLEGDLLFTRLSGSLEYVGNCAIVLDVEGRDIEFPDRLFRGRLVSYVEKEHVQHCFAAASLRRQLERAAKSAAGHQRIGLDDLRSYAVPLPPLEEQRVIAGHVAVGLSAARATGNSINAQYCRSSRLRQSILRRAFEGKLVPQDPTDEPASALLDRIRNERENQVSVAAKKKRTAKKGTKTT